MHCKACDAPMGGHGNLYRTVELETGEKIKVMEDMCRGCRDKIRYKDITKDDTIPTQLNEEGVIKIEGD